jgi:hypothetical protein
MVRRRVARRSQINGRNVGNRSVRAAALLAVLAATTWNVLDLAGIADGTLLVPLANQFGDVGRGFRKTSRCQEQEDWREPAQSAFAWIGVHQ